MSFKRYEVYLWICFWWWMIDVVKDTGLPRFLTFNLVFDIYNICSIVYIKDMLRRSFASLFSQTNETQ